MSDTPKLPPLPAGYMIVHAEDGRPVMLQDLADFAVPADRAALAEDVKRLAWERSESGRDGTAWSEVVAAIDALAAAAPPVSDARDAARLDALAKVDVFDRLDFGRDGWMYADKFGAWHYGTPRECIDAAMAPEQGVQQ